MSTHCFSLWPKKHDVCRVQLCDDLVCGGPHCRRARSWSDGRVGRWMGSTRWFVSFGSTYFTQRLINALFIIGVSSTSIWVFICFALFDKFSSLEEPSKMINERSKWLSKIFWERSSFFFLNRRPFSILESCMPDQKRAYRRITKYLNGWLLEAFQPHSSRSRCLWERQMRNPYMILQVECICITIFMLHVLFVYFCLFIWYHYYTSSSTISWFLMTLLLLASWYVDFQRVCF